MNASLSKRQPTVRRGRPLKFGRPAAPVTITLPADVIASLRHVDQDLSRAIVSIAERRPLARRSPGEARPPIELVPLPGRRALILVDPDAFQNLPELSIIPLADGRGFLALETGRGFPDFELAVIDRLEDKSTLAGERRKLQEVRSVLRTWRVQGIRFETRSIMIASRDPAGKSPQPLSPLKRPRAASS